MPEEETQYLVHFTPLENHIGEVVCVVSIENDPLPPFEFNVVHPEPYLPLCKVNGLVPTHEGNSLRYITLCYIMFHYIN